MRPNAPAGASTTTRRVVCALLAVVALAMFFRASARTADAACTADPPGVAVPAHDSRTLELRIGGWDCVLTSDGTEVASIHLGWWADEPVAHWSGLADTTTFSVRASSDRSDVPGDASTGGSTGGLAASGCCADQVAAILEGDGPVPCRAPVPSAVDTGAGWNVPGSSTVNTAPVGEPSR